MEACNAHYYATRDPLGADGDFTTAPEISQMFGELVGAALADCWTRAGAPDDAIYVELGPGRGTLAADALRVLRAAGFRGEVHLVETSPVLREAQAPVRAGRHLARRRSKRFPAQPMLLVANEFLDALPVRQHVGGIERTVVDCRRRASPSTATARSSRPRRRATRRSRRSPRISPRTAAPR